MTNNELSRQVLLLLKEKGGSIRFRDLAGTAGADARAVFKNLFFLEEKGLVQLATSSPMDTVYPQIHLVRLRKGGETLLADAAKLEAVFPLSDTTTDTHLHIPPEINSAKTVTFEQALELLAAHVRSYLQGDERDAALEKIESLLGLPFVHELLQEVEKGKKG